MSYLQADGELSGKELGDVVRGGVGAVNDLDSQQLLVTESLGDTNLGVAALEKKKKKDNSFPSDFRCIYIMKGQ